MTTGNTKQPHRFPKKFNDIEILRVMQPEEELLTRTIKKRLPYENVSKDWVRKTLGKLYKTGHVEKIKREDEIADYWIITEAGIKKRDEEQENTQ